MVVDGQEVVGDVPPQIINDRTMVPVRFVAQALGAAVGWDAAERRVIIKTSGSAGGTAGGTTGGTTGGSTTTPTTGGTTAPPTTGGLSATTTAFTWSEWLIGTSGLNLPWEQDNKRTGNTPWYVSGSDISFSGWGDGMYHHDFIITQETFDVTDVLVTFEATGSFRTAQGYTGPLIGFVAADDMHSSIAANKTIGAVGSYSWESGKQDRGVYLYGYGSQAYQYFPEQFIDYGDDSFRAYSLRIAGGTMTLTLPDGNAVTLDVSHVQAGLRLPLVLAMRQYDNGKVYSAQIRNLKVVEHPR